MNSLIKKYFKNKTILITGGTGSIGSAVFFNLLQLNCKVIRIMSNDENGLFDLSQKVNLLKKEYTKSSADFYQNMYNDKVRYFLGDIRDYERCLEVTKGANIVIHAAAIKHVEISEYNPSEATKTNVIGTQNMINASVKNKVSKFLLVSTDKVVSPVNIMGVTKLQSEKIVVNSSDFSGSSNLKASVIRCGNILGSRGSVVPKFIQNIKNNKKLIIPDPNIARFVITLNECVNMILNSIYLMKGSEIFILKGMRCFKILDLAKALLTFYKKSKSKITIFKKSNYEKLYEELFTINELDYLYNYKNFYIIKKVKNQKINTIRLKVLASRVSNFNFLNNKKIISLLSKNLLLQK